MHKTLLTRRVEKVLPNKEALEELIEKKGKISLYQGFDPTFTNLHLGHTIGMRKLMDFANAGHDVTFLFGTGTVLVGDPSKRDTGRKLITQEEIDRNIKTWKEQVSPIVDFNKVTIKQNGDWLTKLTLKDIVKIASNISAVQLFKRDSFQKRIEKGDTVWYHETMYPLLQGYDSVHMDVDLEVGGSDQEFNMLVGRELQRKINNREKFVLTTPMIPGTDGEIMSKTRGNCIWLTDTANDMFRKLMEVKDELITTYLELLTNLPMDRVEEVKKGLKSQKIDPRDAKKELAAEVVKQFHSEDLLEKARNYFEETFQKGKPQYETKIKLEGSFVHTISPFTAKKSNSDAKRYIAQGSVTVNKKVIKDPTYELELGDQVKIGSNTFGTVVK